MIEKCSARNVNFHVTPYLDGYARVGGLVGYADDGYTIFYNCYSTGQIEASLEGEERFDPSSPMSLRPTDVSGDVTLFDTSYFDNGIMLGGFIGEVRYQYDYTIQNCYADVKNNVEASPFFHPLCNYQDYEDVQFAVNSYFDESRVNYEARFAEELEWNPDFEWMVLDGAVPNSHLKRKSTFNNWDFERVWVIDDGVSTPRLIHSGEEGYLGEPGTHAKSYVLVKPHVDGTMNFDGATWKYIDTFFRYPEPAPYGEIGEVVAYSITNQEKKLKIAHPETEEIVPVTFVASGIRDRDGAGGFAYYRPETYREVVVQEDISARVNFYYVEDKYFSKGGLSLSICTPDMGVIKAQVNQAGDDPIRVQIKPNEIISIPTVSVDDELATTVRVMTPNGIQALQAHIESGGKWEMEEDE